MSTVTDFNDFKNRTLKKEDVDKYKSNVSSMVYIVNSLDNLNNLDSSSRLTREQVSVLYKEHARDLKALILEMGSMFK